MMKKDAKDRLTVDAFAAICEFVACSIEIMAENLLKWIAEDRNLKTALNRLCL